MKTKFTKEKRLLEVTFNEEIDQHVSDKLRRKIDDEIEKYLPREVIFDFGCISFMDSSAIGMILRKVQANKNDRWRIKNYKC